MAYELTPEELVSYMNAYLLDATHASGQLRERVAAAAFRSSLNCSYE